jgi:hypothetical protein
MNRLKKKLTLTRLTVASLARVAGGVPDWTGDTICNCTGQLCEITVPTLANCVSYINTCNSVATECVTCRPATHPPQCQVA